MIRFIPGETGCLKVLGRSHFGGFFCRKVALFFFAEYWIFERQVSFKRISHSDGRI
jgi:hypothetical protein